MQDVVMLVRGKKSLSKLNNSNSQDWQHFSFYQIVLQKHQLEIAQALLSNARKLIWWETDVKLILLEQILPKLPFLLCRPAAYNQSCRPKTSDIKKKKEVISKETTCKLETGGDIHMWLDGCGRSESG